MFQLKQSSLEFKTEKTKFFICHLLDFFFLEEIAFFYSIINTVSYLEWILVDREEPNLRRQSRATQIPSQVYGLNRLRYSALELIRLLSLIRDCSQARTPDYPPIVPSRAIRVARDVTRDGCTYGPSISSRLETWLRVAGGCFDSRVCNYRNVRNDNEEWLCPPRRPITREGSKEMPGARQARANAL